MIPPNCPGAALPEVWATKQVINGHAYNTEAASLVARRVQQVQIDGVSVGGVTYEEAQIVHEFYVTSWGHFFCLEKWNVLVDDPNWDCRTWLLKKEHITPINREELELSLAKPEGLEIFSETAIDAAAEAAAIESTISVRVSASLKLRVEDAAEKAKLSFNAYILRCLEFAPVGGRCPRRAS